MKILVYRGAAQYNAFNRFAEHLALGFEELDHDVEIADLPRAGTPISKELERALKDKPNLVVSFNALGSELKSAGKSVYEVLDCHFMELLLDHPAFHFKRIAGSPPKAIAGVIDATHIHYLQQTWPNHPVFFAPHGGIQHDEYKNTDRPIEILFLGTGMDAAKERKDWKLLPQSYQKILNAAHEEFLKKPASWEKLITHAAENLNIHLPAQLIAPLVVQLEIVMRAEYRTRVLRALDEAGLRVTIMGNGWEHAKFKNHELHPSVEFYDALKLMTKAKASLNASPQFFAGTHERVFASMLNGSLALTTRSAYYESHMKADEHYLPYELGTLPAVAEHLKNLLKKPSRLEEMRQEALELALTKHTWKSRAGEFLDKFQTIAIAQHLCGK